MKNILSLIATTHRMFNPNGRSILRIWANYRREQQHIQKFQFSNALRRFQTPKDLLNDRKYYYFHQQVMRQHF